MTEVIERADWILFGRNYFDAVQRFGGQLNQHGLAVAMHKADGGRLDWGAYLARALLECGRQFDLLDAGVMAQKDLHERRGLVFEATDRGWRITWLQWRVFGCTRLRDWFRLYPAASAWFYECDNHLTPAQRRAEDQAWRNAGGEL